MTDPCLLLQRPCPLYFFTLGLFLHVNNQVITILRLLLCANGYKINANNNKYSYCSSCYYSNSGKSGPFLTAIEETRWDEKEVLDSLPYFGCLGSDAHEAKIIGWIFLWALWLHIPYFSETVIIPDILLCYFHPFKLVRPWVSVCYWTSYLKICTPGQGGVSHLSSRSLMRKCGSKQVCPHQLQGHPSGASMVPSSRVREKFAVTGVVSGMFKWWISEVKNYFLCEV